jgi:hypothetical protein
MPAWTTIREKTGSQPLIEIVSATRLTGAEFWQRAALGVSLRRLASDRRITSMVATGNTQGLPEVYNSRIGEDSGADILVFMHDDVWIEDYCLADRLLDGLQRFEVIGVAGNRRRLPNQPGWAFSGSADGVEFDQDDDACLSACICHGEHPFQPSFTRRGELPAECELLDGVFLAARKSVLRAGGVGFDNRFDFHFYDMDFCRSARMAGLRLGSWPISLTHVSAGNIGSAGWREQYRRYLDKWQDPAPRPIWL